MSATRKYRTTYYGHDGVTLGHQDNEAEDIAEAARLGARGYIPNGTATLITEAI